MHVATPGSGEGVLKQYAYKKKTEQINVRNSVMFSVGEIDTFAALKARGGSTLMPELRKAWMGERLGFAWADVEKAVVVMGHRYRMSMIVGVQPGRARTLLEDADGGTPQRYIWLPTTDPDAPDEPPAEPDPLRLPAWPKRGEPERASTATDGVTLNFKAELNEYNLEIPAEKSAFHVLSLPPSVVETIRCEQRAKLRGEVSEAEALDSHALLARLKIGVGLMWMNGRADKVTEEDWDLAGVVMDVSNATRADVQAALKSKAVAVTHERGRQEAEREAAKEDHKRARVAERIREKLREKNGQAKAKLKRQFGRDKGYVDEALVSLVAVGDVELEPIEYQGRSGHIVRLKAGR